MTLDKYKYVNTNTWKIEDCPTDFIPCDKEIAYIILLLNKKGYKTFSSCAGHDEVLFSESVYDIDHLEEIQNNPFMKITKITSNYIHALHEIETTTTYINFINGGNYQFDSCPEGFTMRKINSVNRIAISRFVNLYDSNHKRRPHEEIEKELQEGWKSLYKWAKDLKDNK